MPPLPRRRRAPSPGASLEWRPSAWVVSALSAMGILAAIGAFASDLRHPASVAVLSLFAGALLALREARRAHRTLVVGADGSATLDDHPLAALSLEWRGPLAFVTAQDAAGRTHRLAWWPDTLDRATRRALKLAVPTPRRSPRGMRR